MRDLLPGDGNWLQWRHPLACAAQKKGAEAPATTNKGRKGEKPLPFVPDLPDQRRAHAHPRLALRAGGKVGFEHPAPV
jgi:hypothetical protein